MFYLIIKFVNDNIHPISKGEVEVENMKAAFQITYVNDLGEIKITNVIKWILDQLLKVYTITGSSKTNSQEEMIEAINRIRGITYTFSLL